MKSVSENILTIGMPVFNDIKFIEQSILSVLAQSLKNFTLIISDDGSTDGSEAVCRKYAETDQRIIYIRQPKNLGISRNMQFLLSQCHTKYFMWAADDDLWHPEFASRLIALLEKNTEAVSAFSPYVRIDEEGNKIVNIPVDSNYSASSAKERLKIFIKKSDDAFGYGMFRAEKIRDVRFPIWWWPNKNTPYNNIYPTLCYYLAKGDYSYFSEEPLFFRREKTAENTNHYISGRGNGFKETASYIMRRFNLITFTFGQIKNAGGGILALSVYPLLFHRWFITPSWKQFVLAYRAMLKKI